MKIIIALLSTAFTFNVYAEETKTDNIHDLAKRPYIQVEKPELQEQKQRDEKHEQMKLHRLGKMPYMRETSEE